MSFINIDFRLRHQSINQVFVYWRKNSPSDTDAGGIYNSSEVNIRVHLIKEEKGISTA